MGFHRGDRKPAAGGALRERDLVDAGDVVVITAGVACSEPGTTNLVRVRVVE